MENKETQIEEMVKVLHDRIINKTWRAEKVAKELYEITVPEDSVVLSREEYEKLIAPRYIIKTKKLTNKEILEQLKTSTFYVVDNDTNIEIIPTRAEIEKETVEKFANEVYKELYQLGKIYALPETLDADKYGIFSLTQEVVAKIAKEQFCVEIKE